MPRNTEKIKKMIVSNIYHTLSHHYETMQSDFRRILEIRESLYQSDGYNALHRYEKEYVKGVIDTLQKEYEKKHIVFAYIVDGQHYSTRKHPTWPRWDTLPRNLWLDLAPYGAQVYADTGKIYYQAQ